MKVRSDRLPQNDFEINNIQGNECNVVFFDTKNHKEEKMKMKIYHTNMMHTISKQLIEAR